MKYKFKAGDKVKQTINCYGTVAGRIYTVKKGLRNGRCKDDLWLWNYGDGGCNCKHNWEPVANRSKVGKKAYRTFIKNGGSRNSKGQFSKQFSWQKVYDEVREVSNYIDYLVEKEKIVKWDRITKIYLKVFQKHGLISKEIEI